MNITLCEVGPRDGFQFEPKLIPTELKLEVIQALVDAGLPEVQIASFVHPKWVPQMADAEAVCAGAPEGKAVYTGLALNQKGVERARDAGLKHVDLSISTNPTHSRDNANMTLDEAVAQMRGMVQLCHESGLAARAGLQCVWGYKAPGDTPIERILDMSRQIVELNVESLSLADSTGMANPAAMKEALRAVQEVAGNTPLVLHLHDTRGLGMANVVAALECGVTRF
ncbi:MAG: hydroxymethylglutaryl-CoA lyase, partial [Bacteroidota bacterium]